MSDNAYLDKLRSLRLGPRRQTNTTVVTSDVDGKAAGTRTEHRDGRIDAMATRFSVHVNPRLVPHRKDTDE